MAIICLLSSLLSSIMSVFLELHLRLSSNHWSLVIPVIYWKFGFCLHCVYLFWCSLSFLNTWSDDSSFWKNFFIYLCMHMDTLHVYNIWNNGSSPNFCITVKAPWSTFYPGPLLESHEVYREELVSKCEHYFYLDKPQVSPWYPLMTSAEAISPSSFSPVFLQGHT